MNIPEAEFNKFGNAENEVVIQKWGNDKVYYEVKAAMHKGRVLAACSAFSNIEGFGGPVSTATLDFESVKEALSFHKKNAVKWAYKVNPAYGVIIYDSIKQSEEPEQFELF